MEQIKTLNIPGTREMLQRVLVGEGMEEGLREPLHTIIGDLIVRAERAPASVYVCSADADSELRNYFAFVVAKAMLPRVPDVLVVDCDFLSVGLSNIVPERDALGFLDLLLYGSSLEVITQKTSSGVHVIGAGSFPVSRKSPFVMDAFEETVRYLSNHARCVVFCGPALDDDNNAHPILGGVDIRVLVRGGRPQRPNTLDAIEEQVATVGGETWMVRLAEPRRPVSWGTPASAQSADAAEVRPESPPGAVEKEPEPVASDARAAKESPAEAAPPAAEPAKARRTQKPASRRKRGAEADVTPQWDEVRDVPVDGRSGNSIFPRLIIGTLGLLLIGFVAWWLFLTRSIREQIDAPLDMTQVEAQDTPAPSQTGDDAAATDATGDVAGTQADAAAPPADGGTDAQATPAGDAQPVTAPPQPVATRPATGSPAPTTSTTTTSEPDPLAPHVGKYLIHVSSFRRKELAQTDADYLAGRGYNTIVALVDLGAKGLWYRVYVGPFDTRDETRAMKIRLDENPRVRSTRITKVPG